MVFVSVVRGGGMGLAEGFRLCKGEIVLRASRLSHVLPQLRLMLL